MTQKKELTLNEYQQKAMETCMETCKNPLYMLTLLSEETGELFGKFAKAIRKGQIVFQENYLAFRKKTCTHQEVYEITELMKKECGDIMWALAGFCYQMGWELEDVAQTNLDKLASRKQRGVIDGNGDNR